MPFHVGPVQPVKKVALSSNNVRLQCAEGLSIHGLVDPQAWAGAHPQAATTATFWGATPRRRTEEFKVKQEPDNAFVAAKRQVSAPVHVGWPRGALEAPR